MSQFVKSLEQGLALNVHDTFVKLIFCNPPNYNIIFIEVTSAGFVLGAKTLSNFETFPMHTHGISLKLTEHLEIVVLYQSFVKTTYMISK